MTQPSLYRWYVSKNVARGRTHVPWEMSELRSLPLQQALSRRVCYHLMWEAPA